MLEAPDSPARSTAPDDGGDAPFVQRIGELRPEVATLWGDHRHAHLWGADGPAAAAAVDEALVAWRSALESNDATSARTLDRRVLAASLELFRFTRAHLPVWRQDPDVVSPLFLALLAQLRGHFADEEARFATLSSRLNALPEVFESARTHVTTPTTELCERARHVIEGAPLVLRAIVDAGERAGAHGALPVTLLQELHAAAVRAGDALDDMRAWLSGLSAQPHAAVGAAVYDELLHRRGLDVSTEEALHLSRTLAEEFALEERRALRRSFKGKSVREAYEAAQRAQPQSLHECITWVTTLVQESQGFCRGQSSLPALADDSERVVVDAMPALFSADGETSLFIGPQRYSPVHESLLLVGEPWGDAQRQALAELAVGELECMVAHAAYPGRHAFAVMALANTSAARDNNMWGALGAAADVWGSETSEGVGLLAEEMMRELQFRPSAASRLLLLRRVRRCALRSIADVRLGSGAWTPSEASAFLQRHAQLRAPVADAVVRRLLRRPSSALSAVIGRARLLHLRTEARRAWPRTYSDRRFLAFVGAHGAIPLSYVWEGLKTGGGYVVHEKTEAIFRGAATPTG